MKTKRPIDDIWIKTDFDAERQKDGEIERQRDVKTERKEE